MAINTVSIVVGRRGTGKTDYGKECLWQSPQPKRLILDTFDSPPWRDFGSYHHPERKEVLIPVMDVSDLSRWRQGTYRIFSNDIDSVIHRIDVEDIRNVTIYFEDSTKYVSGRLQGSLKNLIYDSKQKNLNLVFFFHSLAAVPPELIRIADNLVLHKTGDNKSVVRRYTIDDLEEIMDELRKSENQYERFIIPLN